MEGSITLPPSSVIIKQVYELRPAPDCIEEPSSAVFMRLYAFVHTLELTHRWLWWHFLQEEFSILKCLSVYKWWCRVTLVEGSVILHTGHYKCWLDQGCVEYLIIRGPLIFFSCNCYNIGGQHGNICSSRSAAPETVRCENSADCLILNYNVSPGWTPSWMITAVNTTYFCVCQRSRCLMLKMYNTWISVYFQKYVEWHLNFLNLGKNLLVMLFVASCR